MEIVRFIQSTLRHPLQPAFSFSVLSVTADLRANGDVDSVMRSLSLEPLSEGTISEQELRQMIACLLEGDMKVFEFSPAELARYVNEIGIHAEFVDEIMGKPHVLVDRDHPAAFDLWSVLAASQGAALGLFQVPETGIALGRDIPLLVVYLASGLIICGSTYGLNKALDYGLYDSLFRSTKFSKPGAHA